MTALREGRDITTSRFNGALRWFGENWPSDLDWPEGIPLPVTLERLDDALEAAGARLSDAEPAE